MPDWTAFAAVTGLVLVLVLALARATSAAVTTTDESASDGDADRSDADSEKVNQRATDLPTDDAVGNEQADDRAPLDGGDGDAGVDRGSDEGRERNTDFDDGFEPAVADRSATPADRSEEPADHAPARSPAPPDDRSRDSAGSVRPEKRATAAESDAPSASGPSGEGLAESTGRTTGGTGVSSSEPNKDRSGDAPPELEDVPTRLLLANVVITHGGFAAMIVGAAALTSIPPSALGVAADSLSTGLPAVAYGVGLGLALYLSNVAMAANLARFGIEHSEALRTSLSPDSIGGWAVLFGVVLPLVAGFEELLFRAALIGGLAVGFGIDPWLLVVLSSAAFALGHGVQGPGGILVTGLLGTVLGVAFVLSNSLLLVVVAHYVVNAAEFVVAEGLEVDLKSAFRIGGG